MGPTTEQPGRPQIEGDKDEGVCGPGDYACCASRAAGQTTDAPADMYCIIHEVSLVDGRCPRAPVAQPRPWRVLCGDGVSVSYDHEVDSEGDAERAAAGCRREYGGQAGTSVEIWAAGRLHRAWDFRLMDTGRGALRWLPRAKGRGLSPDEVLELQDKLQEYFELHLHPECGDYADYDSGYRALFAVLLGGSAYQEFLHDGRPVAGAIVAKLHHRNHQPGESLLCDECADQRLAQALPLSV